MTNEDRIEVLGMIKNALHTVWSGTYYTPDVENALDNAMAEILNQIEDLENEHN